MRTDIIAMELAKGFFEAEPEVVLSWLKIFKGMEPEPAHEELLRLLVALNEGRLSDRDAALIGGVLEDSNTSFMFSYLSGPCGYTQKEALELYVNVRMEFEQMADGLWEGHCIRWTHAQTDRAQRDLTAMRKNEAARRLEQVG
ncbi:hypothetical protein [uncultured Pseudodesulfovibrio sp.]|uniref:hypothetical protein n=1 Tax=uncultured Pseudodesulfovibrio sp. TaxID=2035858 RepID=UPI0029C70B6B|nr:hypothetical protein [uncultured Pseudodesulfovibrio sp.]